jgi:hypothetical protein
MLIHCSIVPQKLLHMMMLKHKDMIAIAPLMEVKEKCPTYGLANLPIPRSCKKKMHLAKAEGTDKTAPSSRDDDSANDQ